MYQGGEASRACVNRAPGRAISKDLRMGLCTHHQHIKNDVGLPKSYRARNERSGCAIHRQNCGRQTMRLHSSLPFSRYFHLAAVRTAAQIGDIVGRAPSL